MQQASLWLPGFDFADALCDSVVDSPPPAPPVTDSHDLLPAQPEETLVALSDDIPVLVESFDLQQPQPAPVQRVQPASLKEVQRSAPPWPLLTSRTHESLTGVVSKFEANCAAIEILRELEAGEQSPSPEQRQKLTLYTGWGGIKQPFDKWPSEGWATRTKRLKALLSEDEFESARGSTLNAHFTPISIIEHLWKTLGRLGFTGGRVLEPSAGAGYMIGAMPESVAMQSTVTAVELDNLTARLLKALYGHQATVQHAGFESVTLPEAFYDLVISNVPFGNYGVGEKRKKAYAAWSIHNYFVARSLDLVRPGGLIAVITSSHFMDARKVEVRDYIARRAKLLGAFRFPAGTFAEIANTEVVADLIILQRRMPNEIMTVQERDSWVNTELLVGHDGKEIRTPNGCGVVVNDYWNQNQDAVIGTWSVTRTQHGQQCLPMMASNADRNQAIQNALEGLPEGGYSPANHDKEVVQTVAMSSGTMLPGQLVEEQGVIYRFDGFDLVRTDIKGLKANRIGSLTKIRDTVAKLIKEQSSRSGDESVMGSLRYELNVRYDGFLAKHGLITSKANRQAFASDPTWPILLALEIYDAEQDKAIKADIFTERTTYPTQAPTKADCAEDALLICQSERGCVDKAYLEELLGRSGDFVLEEMRATGLVFIDPHTRLYQSASEYLSGNVREKLALAQSLGAEFEGNVLALQASLPADLPPTAIDVAPGAPWIDTETYQDFLKELAATDWESTSYAHADVTREPTTGTWGISVYGPIGAVMQSTWGTNRLNGFELFTLCLNQQDAEIKDQDVEGKYILNAVETAQARIKQDELRVKFSQWIWSDDARATRLCRVYNDLYNCWAIRKFDGSKLRLPGYSNALALRKHQTNGIARIATGANTLLAHDVGAGKTVTMVCGSMELKRLGSVHKPLHVVPNHCLDQYAAEFMRAYPQANVLLASKADFEKINRQAFMARCATGAFDAIILTHSMFERIAADEEMTQDYIERILSELRGSKDEAARDRTASRAVNRYIKDWEGRLERMQASWKKDKLITLTGMGVDYIFFDESQIAKNLFRLSAMKNIAGLSNSNSQRSFDLLLKCMQIMRLHGDQEKGVCFASGTPVSNTMAEFHVVQRFLQPYTLERVGLEQFDTWAAQFGRAVNSMEVSPDGASFRMNKRFKQFVNMPELMGLFRQFADIQTKEMLNLPVPRMLTGKEQICAVKPSQAIKDAVAELVARAERIKAGHVRPSDDNMLAITGDGMRVALDMRLFDLRSRFDPESKVAQCIANVHRIWLLSQPFKGTQIIFSDLGTPTGKTFNLYEDIRTRLVTMGIPMEQIAFIHEAKTDHAKAALFAKVRAGSVRVLLGSTAKCGIGTNVQTKLYAIHHLSVPWRPSDLMQRLGRIERQGNMCPEIEVWRYVCEGSFDAYSWQTLTSKAGFIAQVMSGNAEVRTVEDAMMATLSYDEVKALACGNPAVREKAIIDAEIMHLSLKLKRHYDATWDAKMSLNRHPSQVADATRRLEQVKTFLDEVRENAKAGDQFEIEGKKFVEMEKIKQVLTLVVAELRELATKHSQAFTRREIGKLNGVRLDYRRVFGTGFMIEACNEATGYTVELGEYSMGHSIVGKVKAIEEVLVKECGAVESRIAYLVSQEPVLQKMAQAVFEDHGKLEELRARSRQIAIDLGMLKDMEGTASVEAGAEVKSALASQLVVEELTDDEIVHGEALEEMFYF